MANSFVAAPIENVGYWFDNYLENRPNAVRVFHPEDLHMTIAFLGKISADQQAAVIQAMEKLAHAEFEISFHRLVALPNAKRMSALSFSVNAGFQEAVNLIETWRAPIFKSISTEVETRPALPHITIARPERRANSQERKSILGWLKTVEAPRLKIPINRVALYTWSDNRKETQFKILYETPLHA